MRIGLTCVALLVLSAVASAEDRPPLTRPNEAKPPFQNAKQCDLHGFWSFTRGDIAGKKLKDIVTQETTSRVVVLANHTSAPNYVHLTHVARLIESNPTIEPIWTKDKTSGQKKWDPSYDNPTPYFAVLFEDKNGRFTGLLFLARDKGQIVKVVTEAGVGVVSLMPDGKKTGIESKAANIANVDQPFHRLDAEVINILKTKYPDAELKNDKYQESYRLFTRNMREFVVHKLDKVGNWQNAVKEQGPDRGGISVRYSVEKGKWQGALLVPSSGVTSGTSDLHVFKESYVIGNSTDGNWHICANISTPMLDSPEAVAKSLIELFRNFEKYK